MSIIGSGEISQHKTVCARCRAEGLGEDVKEGCMGDCPSCGKFLQHGEDHTTDCTLEEDYAAMMAAHGEDDVCFNGNHPTKDGRCTVDGGLRK